MDLGLLWVICIVAVVHTVSLDVYHWMDVTWMDVIGGHLIIMLVVVMHTMNMICRYYDFMGLWTDMSCLDTAELFKWLIDVGLCLFGVCECVIFK